MSTPVVHTTAGAVQGILVDGVHAYLGIPFAAPPVGPRYLAPPAAPEPWDGVRPATAFGPTAPQPPDAGDLFPSVRVPGDEYLNVNVYTPDPGRAGLPVLVWIHGGAFTFGSNSDPTHGPARLARRGTVVVAVSYRLGFEGFLPLRDAPPNRGVLDWIAALEWVQDNVAAFGGDPGQVTVGGYSAGAGACHVLLANPRAADLFGRVLAMSGAAEASIDLAAAEVRADEVVARFGVDRTVAGLASVPEAARHEAQQALAPLLVMAFGATELFHANFRANAWLGPVVDGEIVPHHPMTGAGSALGAGKPLMIGCTAEEMDGLMGVLGNAVDEAAARTALVEAGCAPDAVGRWFDAHPGRSPGGVLGAALTGRWFRRSILRIAASRFDVPAPTFVYEFAWRPPTPLGAVHCIDVPFAFDTLQDELTADALRLYVGPEPPQSVADDYAAAISRFVVDGDPGWPRYDADTRPVMVFDVPSTVRSDPAHDRAVLDLLDDLQPAAVHLGGAGAAQPGGTGDLSPAAVQPTGQPSEDR